MLEDLIKSITAQIMQEVAKQVENAVLGALGNKEAPIIHRNVNAEKISCSVCGGDLKE